MKFHMVLFFSLVLASFSALATSRREIRRGYFIVKNKELYFTEIFNSTSPLYPVKWWNGKIPVPLCAVNLNPLCTPVRISFEKSAIIVSQKQEIIFTNAIFAADLEANSLRLKNLSNSNSHHKAH